MIAFWDTALCILVEADRRFRGGIVLIMETVLISETSVYFNKTTRRCISSSYDKVHGAEYVLWS
jgi:hypothetical protein